VLALSSKVAWLNATLHRHPLIIQRVCRYKFAAFASPDSLSTPRTTSSYCRIPEDERTCAICQEPYPASGEEGDYPVRVDSSRPDSTCRHVFGRQRRESILRRREADMRGNDIPRPASPSPTNGRAETEYNRNGEPRAPFSGSLVADIRTVPTHTHQLHLLLLEAYPKRLLLLDPSGEIVQRRSVVIWKLREWMRSVNVP
jgi:hypothetical protein